MKTMFPNDLGKILLEDQCEKIEINSFVKAARERLKEELLNAQLSANELPLKMTKSSTGYGGKRYWWLCPICNKRRGVLYKKPLNQVIACRLCLGLKYRSNAKKGMIENQFK